MTSTPNLDDAITIPEDERFTSLLLATSPTGSITYRDLQEARHQLEDFATCTNMYIRYLMGLAIPSWDPEEQVLDFWILEDDEVDDEDEVTDPEADERWGLLTEAIEAVIAEDYDVALEALNGIEPSEALEEMVETLETVTDFIDVVLSSRMTPEELNDPLFVAVKEEPPASNDASNPLTVEDITKLIVGMAEESGLEMDVNDPVSVTVEDKPDGSTVFTVTYDEEGHDCGDPDCVPIELTLTLIPQD